MNKLTVREKIILCVFAAVIVIYGSVNLIYTPLGNKISALKDEKTALKTTLTDKSETDKHLKQLNSDNEDLVKQISEIKKSETAKTLTKEEFLVFLSDAANKDGAQVIKFNDLGTECENGVWKETFDFEIRGTFKSINAVCNRIDLMGIRYSVGSMSLRQDKEYPYLQRKFDSFSNLEWYDDPIKPKEETEEAPVDETIPELPMTIEPLPEFPSVPLEPNPQIPQQQPQREPVQPEPTPEPTPTPPNTNNGNINDRLNELLKPTAYKSSGYKVVLLTNSNETYDNGEIMTLSVTLQLIMYQEPIPGASVVITEDKDNAVL